MQRVPHAGVKLNYPLLSDITKGISAEYEVSQPQLLPSLVACLTQPIQPLPHPDAPCSAVASGQCCISENSVLPVPQLRCLCCCLVMFCTQHTLNAAACPSSVGTQRQECCAALKLC